MSWIEFVFWLELFTASIDKRYHVCIVESCDRTDSHARRSRLPSI
ncbi:MAG: hypothetical protein AB1589_21575 [Cyanobacteriota bacterium]